MSRISYTLCLVALGMVCLNGSPAGAVTVSADTSGGYGAQVMDTILNNWVRPPDAGGTVSVIVRVTNEGRPFSCELRKSSGFAPVDDSICIAVAKAGQFPPTPYGAPAEVALTFILDAPGVVNTPTVDPSTGQPVKTYSEILLDNARPHLQAPPNLVGEFGATIFLRIQPDGTLAEYKMEKPSGNATVDAAILRALLEPGVIPLPPEGKEQNVYLTITMKGQ